jgi:hypothetical protein
MIEMPAVLCDHPGCTEPATHKIASVWKDSQFSELKTYGFACQQHAPEIYRNAEVRWLEYEPVPGESVGKIGIYHYEKGVGDRNLRHDQSLESTLIS